MKLREKWKWKPLGEDVCVLKSRGNMKNMNVTDSDFFPGKVDSELYVFGTLMLNRVSILVYGTNVVAVDKCSRARRRVKFSEKVAEPIRLGYNIC